MLRTEARLLNRSNFDLSGTTQRGDETNLYVSLIGVEFGRTSVADYLELLVNKSPMVPAKNLNTKVYGTPKLVFSSHTA